MESGDEVATFVIDHPLRTTLAWMPDESRLVTVARPRGGTESLLEVFALP